MNVLVKRDSLCSIMRKKFAEILALTLSILSAMIQAHLDSFFLFAYLIEILNNGSPFGVQPLSGIINPNKKWPLWTMQISSALSPVRLLCCDSTNGLQEAC